MSGKLCRDRGVYEQIYDMNIYKSLVKVKGNISYFILASIGTVVGPSPSGDEARLGKMYWQFGSARVNQNMEVRIFKLNNTILFCQAKVLSIPQNKKNVSTFSTIPIYV